ncbi:UNVERIFIED_CONTAM: hypothetical protein HDU68_009344 [Siphonaria sp. JEL0065]|nr:hypothetical protein HDU68_009344 [Siphonaria sp. JEL0065]
MTAWVPPSDGAWKFALIGPQAKVGAGEQWYLRAPNSINGVTNLNPDQATIKALSPPAINGNPNSVGQFTGSKPGTGSTGSTGTTGGTTTNSGPAAPAWRLPVIVGGSILGFILVLALGSFIYSKRNRAKEAEEEAQAARQKRQQELQQQQSSRIAPSSSNEPLRSNNNHSSKPSSDEQVVEYSDLVNGRKSHVGGPEPSILTHTSASTYNVANYGPPNLAYQPGPPQPGQYPQQQAYQPYRPAGAPVPVPQAAYPPQQAYYPPQLPQPVYGAQPIPQQPQFYGQQVVPPAQQYGQAPMQFNGPPPPPQQRQYPPPPSQRRY